MTSAAQRQATCAVVVAALLLCAPAHAATVVDADGKPVRVAPETKLVDGVAWVLPVIRALLRVLSYLPAAEEPYVTALVRVQDLPPEEQERVLLRHGGGVCHGDFLNPVQTIVITDRRSNIERILGHPID